MLKKYSQWCPFSAGKIFQKFLPTEGKNVRNAEDSETEGHSVEIFARHPDLASDDRGHWSQSELVQFWAIACS
jgi:hypothetical protein